MAVELWLKVLFPVQRLYVDSKRAHLRARDGVVLFLFVLFTVLFLLVVLPASNVRGSAGRSTSGSRSGGGRGNGGRSVILVFVVLLALGLSVVSTCSLKARQKHTHVIIIIIVVSARRAASGSIGPIVGGGRSG